MEMSTDDLVDAAELGEEAKQFLSSDLGRTLIGRAEQEATAALEQLGVTDPEDTVTIRHLQAQLSVARKFPEWLREIMDIGESAKQAWIQQRNEHG